MSSMSSISSISSITLHIPRPQYPSQKLRRTFASPLLSLLATHILLFFISCFCGLRGPVLIVEQEFCQDWYTWADAFHVSSGAGGYIVSYLVFIILAVRSLIPPLFFSYLSRFVSSMGIVVGLSPLLVTSWIVTWLSPVTPWTPLLSPSLSLWISPTPHLVPLDSHRFQATNNARSFPPAQQVSLSSLTHPMQNIAEFQKLRPC